MESGDPDALGAVSDEVIDTGPHLSGRLVRECDGQDVPWVHTALIDQIDSDEHSPAIIRVNAILSTLDVFYETYDVTEGDGMYIAPEDRISRWH